VNIFVDTSVWSLAFRRDSPPETPEVQRLREALGADAVHTTGLVLQELLQGFSGPRARAQILDRFAAIALIAPTRDDHIEAARLRNACRRRGIQIGTIDALLARLCIVHELVMLTADRDFASIAESTPLRLWRAP
jgi:predicted nucleic acid-binding protein